MSKKVVVNMPEIGERHIRLFLGRLQQNQAPPRQVILSSNPDYDNDWIYEKFALPQFKKKQDTPMNKVHYRLSFDLHPIPGD